MKKVLILFFLLQAFIIHAQDSNENFQQNSTSASIFLPIPYLQISINQERYFKEKVSFDSRVSFISFVNPTVLNISSIILGPKWYFSAPRNNKHLYWVHPTIIWRYTQLNSTTTSYRSKIEYYHVGTTIGKRHFIIQDTFFWDIGIGVSYGIGIYRFYKKFDTEGL
ncbi:MAG TPA: hypothetical protein PLS12_04975 [Bacteroidales bacterium]|nr:hypothetical protein [Bacteroidales bacterium]